jgi:hypothetical protein
MPDPLGSGWIRQSMTQPTIDRYLSNPVQLHNGRVNHARPNISGEANRATSLAEQPAVVDARCMRGGRPFWHGSTRCNAHRRSQFGGNLRRVTRKRTCTPRKRATRISTSWIPATLGAGGCQEFYHNTLPCFFVFLDPKAGRCQELRTWGLAGIRLGFPWFK